MQTPSPLMRRGGRGLLWDDEDEEPEMDTAAIRVHNGLKVPVEVFGQVTECVECPLENLSGPIESGSDMNLTLTTNYGYRLEVRQYNDTDYDYDYEEPKPTHVPCSRDYHFDEFGQYTWNVTANYSSPGDGLSTTMKTTMETTEEYNYEEPPTSDEPDYGYVRTTRNLQMDCNLQVISDGYPTYLPILVYGIGVLLALPLIWLLIAVINRVLRLYAPRVYALIWAVLSFLAAPKTFLTQRASAPAQPQSDQITGSKPAATSDAGEATVDGALSKKEDSDNSRLVCVDTLRGIAISIMIFGTALVIMA